MRRPDSSHPDRRMPVSPLSDIEIQRAFGTLPGWSRKGDVITKTYAMPTFLAGIAFVGRIADAAERVNHHPDIDIRYTRVVITLSTHDAGGITQKDIDLAGTIETLQAA
jgi:4a-hydroxytetrahydrobiopterin dehydratase